MSETVTDLYGSMVFDEAAMKEYLSDRTFDTWKECVRTGKTLDIEAAEEIAEALKDVKYLAIMDRTEDFETNCGPLGSEIKSALFNKNLRPLTLNYCYGLGGRDVTVESLTSVFEDLFEVEKTGDLGEVYRYLSVRE